MKEIGVGLLGFGTVGAGVVDTLTRQAGLLAARTGVRLTLRGVADLDLTTDRGVAVDRSLLTTDAARVIDDPAVRLVVELIGGTTVARDLTLRALRHGKPVVTANKALLATHGAELFHTARLHKTGLYYEASVGGGIPCLRAIRQGLVANHIISIHGIVNGTCNYILTRMEEEQAPFDEVLAEAQRLGFAEYDSSLDVDGHDTAHKAVVLASLACGRPVPLDAVQTSGIRGISCDDLLYARELGYRIKLLAVIHPAAGEAVEISVEPCLVPSAHLLGAVHGVFNAVLVRGDVVGDTLYYGRGAGRQPTASAVVSDLADAAQRLVHGAPHDAGPDGEPAKVRPVDHGRARSRHYLRLSLRNRAGALARASDVLARHGISIASVLQKEDGAGDGLVPVLVLTHRAPARAMAAARKELDEMNEAGAPAAHFRIEDFEGESA